MKNHVKELHYIFYLPGTGGNFMTRLFSLSEDTQFLWIQGSCGCLPANTGLDEKIKWYTFKDSDAAHWSADAHLLPYGLHIHENSPFYNPGSKLIASSHFSNYIPSNGSLNLTSFTSFPIKEKYYYIDVDPELYTFMNRYLHADRHAGNEIGGTGWQLMNDLISSDIDLQPIHLKPMLDSDEGFLSEYKRVCGLMGLSPVDTKVVLAFFHNWRRLRVDNPRLRS